MIMLYSFWVSGDYGSKYADICHCTGAAGRNSDFKSDILSGYPLIMTRFYIGL